jgi:DNA-directed RNA polymerase specialized sigma24 family protein
MDAEELSLCAFAVDEAEAAAVDAEERARTLRAALVTAHVDARLWWLARRWPGIDTEDLVQEARLGLLVRGQRWRGGGNGEGFLFTQAPFAVADAARRLRPREVPSEDVELGDDGEVNDKRDDQIALHQALGRLPLRTRAAVTDAFGLDGADSAPASRRIRRSTTVRRGLDVLARLTRDPA